MLCKHPKIEKVLYPGLKNHPGYEINKSQWKGYGWIVSFYLN